MNYSRGLPWSSDEDDYLCELRSDQVPFPMIAARITARFGHRRTNDACIGRWWVMEKEADLALAKAQAASEIREKGRRERICVPARFYVPEVNLKPEPRVLSDDPKRVKDRERKSRSAAQRRAEKKTQKQALSVAMDPKPAPMVIPELRSRHYTTNWT